MFFRYMRTIFTVTAVLGVSSAVLGGELFVGAASSEITPPEPVALCGQFGLRISTGIETPLRANVVVVESREGDRSVDLAVVVSCDVISIPTDLLALVRKEVAAQLPDLETAKIFLGGTHTHTAPELRPGVWILPDEGVMRAEEYRDFFAEKVAEAIVKAFKAERRAALRGAWATPWWPTTGEPSTPTVRPGCTVRRPGRSSAAWKAMKITTWARCSSGTRRAGSWRLR